MEKKIKDLETTVWCTFGAIFLCVGLILWLGVNVIQLKTDVKFQLESVEYKQTVLNSNFGVMAEAIKDLRFHVKYGDSITIKQNEIEMKIARTRAEYEIALAQRDALLQNKKE